MRHKNIKPAAAVMIVYLLLSAGLLMFLYSLTLSGANITGERLAPAELTVTDGKTELHLAGAVFAAGTRLPDSSNVYLAGYLLSPDEVRAEAYVLAMIMP